MSNPSRCRHVTLVQTGIAQVQSCADCGCVSVHLGPTTVRFDPEGLEALWLVLGEALELLRQDRALGAARASVRGVA